MVFIDVFNAILSTSVGLNFKISDLDTSCQIGNITWSSPLNSLAVKPFNSYSVQSFLIKDLDKTTTPNREFANP